MNTLDSCQDAVNNLDLRLALTLFWQHLYLQRWSKGDLKVETLIPSQAESLRLRKPAQI